MEQYFYLIWTAIFLIVWLALFYVRKDTRNEMIVISGMFGLGGVAAEKTNIIDWWQPLTITGTRIGIEDFVIGFAIGGVAAVVYEVFYHQRFIQGRSRAIKRTDSGFFLLLFPLLYLTFFYLLELGSFYSVLAACLICIGYLFLTRKDLVVDSLMSGLLMLFIGFAIYALLFLVHPTYIQDFWYLPDVWYAKLILGIPIAEYAWYFFIGAYIGPLYEFLLHKKLTRK